MKYSQETSKGISLPIVIPTVLLVLVVGAVVALFATGTIKVNQSVVSANESGLCDNLIANYNTAFMQTSAEAYAAKLADSAKAAAAVEGNQSDPNCVFIQLTNAGYARNVEDSKKFATTLKSLANEGKYITGQLANPLGLKAIEENAALVTAPGETNLTPNGNG